MNCTLSYRVSRRTLLFVHSILVLAVCICSDVSRAGEVLLSGHYAAIGDYPTAVFVFERDGSSSSLIGDADRGSYGTVATFGGEIFIGNTGAADGKEIARFSQDGDFLGYFGPPDLSLKGAWKMEFDSFGNLYAVDAWNSKAVRLDSNGLVTGSFPAGGSIDADANGYVYVSHSKKRLGKYNPSGDLITMLNIPEWRGPGDMAIDELNGLLYLSDESDVSFGIKQYDISGSGPVFLTAIPTPGGVCGISFDEKTGHLLAAQVGIGTPPRALEMLIDGTIIQEYNLDGSGFIFDVAAIQNPEPSSFVLVSLAGLCFLQSRSTLLGS
jgi:hypothetical protein